MEARSRISHNHRIALNAPRHSRANSRDYSGYLVTKTSGCALEKNRVASAERFQIGATCCSGCYL
jgi:hypothetical protein